MGRTASFRDITAAQCRERVLEKSSIREALNGTSLRELYYYYKCL